MPIRKSILSLSLHNNDDSYHHLEHNIGELICIKDLIIILPTNYKLYKFRKGEKYWLYEYYRYDNKETFRISPIDFRVSGAGFPMESKTSAQAGGKFLFIEDYFTTKMEIRKEKLKKLNQLK